jgi:hypothetical protein
VTDSSQASIVIDADPATVMAVIADFDRYPEWAGVKTTQVLSTFPDGRAQEVNLTIDAGIVKDDYVLAYTWDRDVTCSWTQVRSKMMKSQVGTYTLTPVPEGTEVSYELAVDLAVPMLGLLKRKGEKLIMDTALKGLKKHVESL